MREVKVAENLEPPSIRFNEKDIFLIDSNLLIYAYSEKDEKKKIIVANLLKKCWEGKEIYAVSTQNLAEFFSIANRKYKMNPQKAKIVIEDINNFEGFIKLNYSGNTVANSIDLMEENKTSFWDALIMATMKENGIFNIYTENINDFKAPWIKAVNPFEKG